MSMPALFITKENAKIVREFFAAHPSEPITVESLFEATPESFSRNSATKVVSSLSKLNVLDRDGNPTSLGINWLTPKTCAKASEQIIRDFFPPKMLDLFSNKDKSSKIAEWLTEHADIGVESAKKDAYVFRLLCEESKDLGSNAEDHPGKTLSKRAAPLKEPERTSSFKEKPSHCIRVPLSASAQDLQKIINLAKANEMDITCY